mmetsp:Transcript_20896/g.35932  ORF Transcript_20896/g.35932 Transcript_20896/m.35932 type:complete len:91 (-) Transcript_20896:27-299(-)
MRRKTILPTLENTPKPAVPSTKPITKAPCKQKINHTLGQSMNEADGQVTLPATANTLGQPMTNKEQVAKPAKGAAKGADVEAIAQHDKIK